MSEKGVICIMNIYKRPYAFSEQFNAIKSQTVSPNKIIIWSNNNKIKIGNDIMNDPNVIIIESSQNLGVWPRFFSCYYLLNTKYVCVFDDDTIPGSQWLENCINTIEKNNALLSTLGIVYNQGPETYDNPAFIYGWRNNKEDNDDKCIQFVDTPGHSWFFRKEWIDVFIRDLPSIDGADKEMLVCGEDMHLSYTLQKYLNIPTIVPPHPKNNKSVWGSDPNKAILYGGPNSTYAAFNSDGRFIRAIKRYVNMGYETIMNRRKNIKVYRNCADYFINKIKLGENFALIRFADGEQYVLEDKTLTNCDYWTYKMGSILSQHLNEALKLINTNVYYGISGPSDNVETCNYYLNKIPNTHNITFSNVFVNENYSKWKKFLEEERECFLIACNIPKMIGKIYVRDSLKIDELLVNKWDSCWEDYFSKMKVISKKYTGMLYLVSAGPLSEVFIHRMYIENPKNIYIDVGSSIDEFVKGRKTRPYQKEGTMVYQDVLDIPTVF